jgi:glyoxylase-like metal-dependent hydrolase (beta-lactamase superfamily II)
MRGAITRTVLAVALVTAVAAPAAAQVNFAGEWTGRYHEDQPDRVPGEEPGDFSGIPVNEAARRFGDSYDVGRHSVLEEQCAPYTLPYMFFGPNQFRIWQQTNPDTQELVALEMFLGTFQQRRTIWLDGRPHPPAYAPHTFMGFSTGEWNGDTLTITTTHIKQGYFRRSGVPASDRTTVVEHWMRHGDVLSQVTIATDPVYLTEPYIRSQDFVLMERGNTNWLYNCEYAMELPRDKNLVPHYLPGKNPWLGEFERKHAMPTEGVRGGAESLLPDWKPGAPAARPNPAKNGGFAASVQPAALAAGEVRAVKVQGNVYMIVGAGANIAAHVGEDGIIVVDTGAAGQGDKVVAAVKALAPDKEIRWVINTSPNADHTANNERVSKAGRTVNGNQAAVVAHENANERMIARNVPDAARPYNTYFEAGRDFPFNGEPVMLLHDASSVDDAETVVFFRRSDVLVTGDVFRTDSFPVIDIASGGTTQGTIDALNRLLDLAVPSKMLQEAGTYIIPGHGRIADEHDLVWYRDMMVIIRDRVQDMVSRKMTLEQVQAAKPALDYEGRYGADSGPWTTAMFVEAIYKDLSRASAAGGK